jgi:nucleotide-binding universal stress UspA family protein
VSIRSILACIDPAANAEGVLDVAVILAGRQRADLVGLHVVADANGQSAADALEATFRERALAAQLTHEWHSVRDQRGRIIPLEARGHDLLVMGRTRSDPKGLWPRLNHRLESALLKSGHALVAVPPQGAFTHVGDRVLVAWNGDREAARAVEDAMPILEKAQSVTLVTVDLRSGDALSIDRLVALLERHGVAVEVQGARTLDRPVGEVLLTKAREVRADLVVMGAYGRSPLREHLFGGVSDFVLGHLDRPALLAH